MRRPVEIDHRRCRRHGLCAIVAPTVFALGRDGRVRVAQPATAESMRAAREAERYCPLQAIDVDGGR